MQDWLIDVMVMVMVMVAVQDLDVVEVLNSRESLTNAKICQFLLT